jgi:hypothetical protein
MDIADALSGLGDAHEGRTRPFANALGYTAVSPPELSGTVAWYRTTFLRGLLTPAGRPVISARVAPCQTPNPI